MFFIPLILLAACGGSDDVVRTLDDLPRGEEQRVRLCAQLEDEGVRSAVRDAFCGDDRSDVRSLKDLQRALDLGCPDEDDAPLGFDPLAPFGEGELTPEQEAAASRCSGGTFNLMSLSSSLVMNQVSPLNPRALIFDDPAVGGRRFLGFTRGDHFAEVITEDPSSGDLDFFLVQFEQPCTERGDCSNADLYTDRIESGWTEVSVFSGDDLKNTTLDCLQCHMSGTPDRPAERPSLLFHELERPWPHSISPFGFDDLPPEQTAGFASERPNKRLYLEARQGETHFAGLPVQATVVVGAPFFLENAVNQTSGDGFTPGLTTTSQPGSSRYRRFSQEELTSMNEAGQIIQFPTKRAGDLTDPDKVERALQSLADFRAGLSDDIEDLSDVFPDARADRYDRLSLTVKPGASGREILTQACTQCHNDRLDQTLTRARFNVPRLDEMGDAELELAIDRLRLPSGDPLRMPPERFRTLDAEEIDRAVDALRSQAGG